MKRPLFARIPSLGLLVSVAIPLGIAGGAIASGCSGGPVDTGEGGSGGSGGGGQTCNIPAAAFDLGDPDGHADPLGAKAAGQARAGRIKSPDQIVQPAHERQKIRVGDFWLV